MSGIHSLDSMLFMLSHTLVPYTGSFANEVDQFGELKISTMKQLSEPIFFLNFASSLFPSISIDHYFAKVLSALVQSLFFKALEAFKGFDSKPTVPVPKPTVHRKSAKSVG